MKTSSVTFVCQYVAPSGECYYNTLIMLLLFFIVKCGVVRFLCTMHVFDVQAPSLSLHCLCAKFSFFRGLHYWASPRRKIGYSSIHSVTQLIWCPGNSLVLRNITSLSELIYDGFEFCQLFWPMSWQNLFNDCGLCRTQFSSFSLPGSLVVFLRHRLIVWHWWINDVNCIFPVCREFTVCSSNMITSSQLNK